MADGAGHDNTRAEDLRGPEGGDDRCAVVVSKTAGRSVTATEGWSPLEFYAWIVRTLGIPDKFRLTDQGWVADAPFTKATEATLAMLEGHGV